MLRKEKPRRSGIGHEPLRLQRNSFQVAGGAGQLIACPYRLLAAAARRVGSCRRISALRRIAEALVLTILPGPLRIVALGVRRCRESGGSKSD